MNSPVRPPKPARALLKSFSPPHLKDAAVGDFEELFILKAEQSGRLRAGLWYWGQALRAVVFSFYWGGLMFRNSMKVTWRIFKRHKGYSLINITGLALGMACCTLILIWVRDELGWDRFHRNSDTLFCVVQKQMDGHRTPVTPSPLAGLLKTEFHQVVEAVRYRNYYDLQIKYGNRGVSGRPIIADPSFFRTFTFPLVSGNPEAVLSEPGSLVVSELLASRLFGGEDPLDKTVLINNRTPLKVTGIMQDVPRRSSLRFDCVLPLQIVTSGRDDSDWSGSSVRTFIRLREDASPDDFTEAIAGLAREHDPDNGALLELQPLSDLHLRAGDGGGPILYIYIFSAMAAFVLLIACINFVNLTTARSATRAREVCLRKVTGAQRLGLIRQFFIESLLFSIGSAFASLVLILFFLSNFNSLSGRDFSFLTDILGNPAVILGVIGIVLVSGLLSGFYPALILSSLQPARVLRAAPGTSGRSRSPLFRKILVVLQFSISVFLMAGTLVVYKQIHYVRRSDLGFDASDIVYSGSPWGDVDLQTIRNELLANPGIVNVTFASQRMGEWESGAREDVKWQGRPEGLHITFEVISCDPHFLDVHGMEMALGRFFSPEIPSDRGVAFVINETAASEMGFGDASPLGEELAFWGRYSGTIIGVVKDFHTQSLHNRIQPVILLYEPRTFDNIAVRIRSGDLTRTLGFIESKWRELTNGFSFDYAFLDDSLDEFYRTERTTGRLLKSFTALAMFISCIGLLGLISFVGQMRTKEIGVRKILGASSGSIIKLLTGEFLLLVLLSGLIAWPAAWIVLDGWLENFAYRTDVGLWPFVLATAAAFAIALVTFSWQAYRIAGADPVESLRYE